MNQKAENIQPNQEELLLENQSLHSQVEELEEKLYRLNQRYETLVQAVLLSQKARFGASTEKNQVDVNQLNLFSQELACHLEGEMPEPVRITVKGHVRPVRVKEDRTKAVKDLDIRVKECTLNEDEAVCDYCGSPMEEIGRKTVRQEVVYHKPYLEVVRYVQVAYKCTNCDPQEEYPCGYIKKAPVPAPLLPHSYASASIVAEILYQKFALSVPLYRQERNWARLHFPISRTRMAYWVIRVSRLYLEPICARMKEYLVKRDLIMSDETTWQCNAEPGKKASSKDYIWVHRSCPLDGEPPVVLYQYTRTRAGENARLFLEDFSGYSVTDAYVGYEKVEGIIRCLCFSHLRRYYLEAMPRGKDKKPLAGSAASIGYGYCNKLFALERKWKNLSPEERLEKRLVYSRPVLDAFFAWAESVKTDQVYLKKALNYTLNHREYFSNFLLDGRIPLSNNSSEQMVKIVALNRKNSLFSDSIAGAEASACLFGIINTAMSNGLDTYEYLYRLLKELPGKDLTDPAVLDAYLPWAEEMQRSCLIQKAKSQEVIAEEEANHESA